jgi:hypothetical protein
MWGCQFAFDAGHSFPIDSYAPSFIDKGAHRRADKPWA